MPTKKYPPPLPKIKKLKGETYSNIRFLNIETLGLDEQSALSPTFLPSLDPNGSAAMIGEVGCWKVESCFLNQR